MYRISITYNMYNVHDIYQLSAPCTEYPRCRYSYSLRTYNCTFTKYSELTTCTKYSRRSTLYRKKKLYRIFRTYNMYTVQESKYVQDNVYIVHCTGSKTCTGYLGRTRFTLYSVQEVKHVHNEKGQE